MALLRCGCFPLGLMSLLLGLSLRSLIVTAASSGLPVTITHHSQLVNIEVGTPRPGTPHQQFTCVIDSGSSDLWVPAENCAGCNSLHAFTPQNSHTADVTDKFVRLPYGSGQVIGREALDFVTFGDLQFKQRFILVENAELPQDRGWDGVCGLGWEGLARLKPALYISIQQATPLRTATESPPLGTAENTQAASPSWNSGMPTQAAQQNQGGTAVRTMYGKASRPTEAMDVQGVSTSGSLGMTSGSALSTKPIFALLPPTSDQRVLSVGQVPSMPMWWARVEPTEGTSGPGYWMVQGEVGIKFRKSEPEQKMGPGHLIVDTGMNQALLVPPEEFDNFIHMLLPPHISQDHCKSDTSPSDGSLVVLCLCSVRERLDLPSLTLHFGRGEFPVPLSKLFVTAPTTNGGQICVLTIKKNTVYPSAGPASSLSGLLDKFWRGLHGKPTSTQTAPADRVWIVGSAFLENFNVVFDFEKQRLGLSSVIVDSNTSPIIEQTKLVKPILGSGSRLGQPAWRRVAPPILSGALFALVAAVAAVRLRHVDWSSRATRDSSWCNFSPLCPADGLAMSVPRHNFGLAQGDASDCTVEC